MSSGVAGVHGALLAVLKMAVAHPLRRKPATAARKTDLIAGEF
jgi:hypothetical protein